jgi:RNA polymerase subunit RPABC4/transcription elongation factor Spt4
MIGEGPSLIEILPSGLQQALDQNLQSSEKPLVALRGNPHEAFAATAARLLTLREGTGIMDEVSVQAYPLADAQEIDLVESASGAALTWTLRGQPEPVTFPVPSYDAAKYRMAVNAIRRELRQDTGVQAVSGPARASRCPKCSTDVPAEGAFCPACGLQTRDVCWECGRALETEWRFCPFCGGEATEPGVIPCPSCGTAVERDHSFCTGCGKAVRTTCDECDRLLRRSWAHCPDCGASSPGVIAGGGGAVRVERREPREPSTPFAETGDVHPSQSSDEAEALNQRGIEAYERERFDQAIDLFRRALALDPRNATFHCNLAVACGEKGLDYEAFTEYQQTLALDPSNVTALVNLGYLYSEKERYEEARDCWERAIRVAPDSPEAAEARASLENLEQL